MGLTYFATFCFLLGTVLSLPAEECPPNVSSIFLPNLDDCKTYYNCSYGKLQLMDCPSGLVFNAKFRMCDLPDRAECAQIKKAVEVECPYEDVVMAIVPHPTDCTRYFVCERGEPLEMECEEGVFFNPDSLNCDTDVCWTD